METLEVRPLAEWYLRDAADGGVEKGSLNKISFSVHLIKIKIEPMHLESDFKHFCSDLSMENSYELRLCEEISVVSVHTSSDLIRRRFEVVGDIDFPDRSLRAFRFNMSEG